MPVIEFRPRAHPVGIIDTIDAASLRIMKCKAIFDAVWTTSAWHDPAYFEFDGITFGEPEFLAIEAQERFELMVRAARHPISTTKTETLHHIMM